MLLPLSLCAAALLSAPQSSVYLESEVVEIPMDLSTDHINVEVLIGEELASFNLDTYAVTTACVDQRFAERMGFEKVDTAWNGDGSGKVRELDVVLIPRLHVGGASFDNVRALVDDYSWVAKPGGGSIDGLLGYHLFAELLLELDYPGSRVLLREGSLSMEDPHVIEHSALRLIPDIPLRIGERTVVVGIDSGADSSLCLPASFLEEHELRAPAEVAGEAKTVYSQAQILTGVLRERVSFAGHEHPGVKATFSELFGKPLIGHGLLVGYRLTFDQRNGRARFLR